MAFAGMCPYLKDARSCERTICECARFTFPDKVSRRELLYGYCGHPTEWKNCTFKSIMDRFYERKYSSDECASDQAAQIMKNRKSKQRTNLAVQARAEGNERSRNDRLF